MKIYLLMMGMFFTVHLSAARQILCTAWEKQNRETCVFTNLKATSWKRQCEQPCGADRPSDTCSNESFCHNLNPNQLMQNCTPWSISEGKTCLSHTGEFEQQWERACQYGNMNTVWCSDTNPNTSR